MNGNFCGRCGSPLTEQGLCPSCDQMQINQIRMQSGKKEKTAGTLKILVIVSAVLAVGLIVAMLFVNNYIPLPFGKKGNEATTAPAPTQIEVTGDGTAELPSGNDAEELVESPEEAEATEDPSGNEIG
ncbi:MAG: hypothetical protein IJJ85_09050 [Clostridia bacterium]|nr:hypothetical protein [Clostridia bacterium]